MKHGEYLVDLVDENGTVVGTKQRGEIDKSADLYHTIFAILCTPDDRLILSQIPDRQDLPNLYPGSIGATVATIRRHNELADEAGLRAVKNELYIDDVHLTSLGSTYLELPDGHKKYMSVYRGIHAMPESFSHKDIENLATFDQHKLADAMQFNQGQFAPTFLAIWQKYQEDLFDIVGA